MRGIYSVSIYSVTYVEGNRNIVNSNAKWNTQRQRVKHRHLSLMFPFFLRKLVCEGHTTQ